MTLSQLAARGFALAACTTLCIHAQTPCRKDISLTVTATWSTTAGGAGDSDSYRNSNASCLTAATRSVSGSGVSTQNISNGASVNGRVSLAQGHLGLIISAFGVGSNGGAAAAGSGDLRFSDAVTLSIPGATANTVSIVPFSASLTGSASGGQPGEIFFQTIVNGCGLTRDSHGAVITPATPDPRYCVTGGSVDPSPTQSTLSGSVRVVGPNPRLTIHMRLFANAYAPVTLDLFHTAAFAFQLPTGVTFTSDSGVFLTGAGNHFVPVAPCRLVDTRLANGPLGGPVIAALATRNFPVRSACGLPANSEAYSLNVTVVPRGPLGYLSIWPGGLSQPLVSTLNSLDGRIKANAAIVPGGPDGSVNVFVTDLADVIIDVNGVFVPQGSNPNGQAFYPVTPCRISDSRSPGGGGVLQAQVNRTIIVANASGCGIPVNATAYATTVTVVPRQPLGFLTMWPRNGSARPTVSTLNALTGAVTANMAIVPAGSASDILAFATDGTDLIVDITGYFAPPGGLGGLNFYTLTPCRVLDTRLANGELGGPVQQPGSTRDYPVLSSNCNVPSDAEAYSMNATVVPPAALGFLTLFPLGVNRPVVSTLNAVDGSITSNAALVRAGADGKISAYVTERTHLILDINGYFAPGPPSN